MLGYDAFKRSLRAGFEQSVTITIKLITELNAIFGIVAD
jgi:hypothetical protein